MGRLDISEQGFSKAFRQAVITQCPFKPQGPMQFMSRDTFSICCQWVRWVSILYLMVILSSHQEFQFGAQL